MDTLTMPRPEPPGESHPGYEWVVAEDDNWTTNPDVLGSFGCRASAGYHKPGCGRPVVAALMRRRYRYIPPMDLSGLHRTPWRYCERHLYGRWIENGHVLMWVIRKVGQP